MQPTEFTLRAVDDAPLAARLFAPASAPRSAVALLGGTAIPQRFYAPLAAHLAAQGHAVLTFDYRGVGGSRPRSLRGHRATMSEWARYDLEAALVEARARTPGVPLVALAHSFGGQALGLAPSAPRLVDAAVLVASGTGDARLYPMPWRARNALVFRAMVPVATALLGYYPGALGMGEDLPAGVAREWARWCNTPGYLSAHVPAADRFHGALAVPMLCLSATDDTYAPPRTIEQLASWYTAARIERHALTPRAKPIGHFNLLRRGHTPEAWEAITAFVDRHARPRPPLDTAPTRAVNSAP